MKFTKLNIMKLILIAILVLLLTYFLKQITAQSENFDPTTKKYVNKNKNFNEKIYPLSDKLTKSENDFIDKWIRKLENDDIKQKKHISSFTLSITLNKDGPVNKSRFGIGTKTKHKDFKNDIMKLLKQFEVETFLPDGYKYYGIAWDISDNLIKLYGLNDEDTKILCKVYNVKRDKNNNITNITFNSDKNYKVGKEKTIMNKNGKNISQYNTSSMMLPNLFYKEYSKLNDIMRKMKDNKYNLDTYSEYDNKLNLYFD